MDGRILETCDASLARCNARDDFLDLFYDKFLASSPKVREKFADTDFVQQKEALRASLELMLLAAKDEELGPAQHLSELAARHARGQLAIGAELYDLWLDSLLAAARERDPRFSAEVEQAWERVMMVGIAFMLDRY